MDANLQPQERNVDTGLAKEDPEAGPDAHRLSGPETSLDKQEPNEPRIETQVTREYACVRACMCALRACAACAALRCVRGVRACVRACVVA